jgi:multimeric flavodoxin WrbA
LKVLILNGSPRDRGNTARALAEMTAVFDANNVEWILVHVGKKLIQGCTGCLRCYELGKCVIDDIVNKVAPMVAEVDGIVIGAPVYFASPPGTLISFLDRLFYSSRDSIDKTMKVGASVAVARRGGITSTFDVLNKYFTGSQMPVVSSDYWNGVHGRVPGDAEHDAEGLQTIRILAENMTFLMRSINLGKEQFSLPEKKEKIRTNFIR